MTTNQNEDRRGAYALTGKKRGIGWLPWLLLALLLLLALGVWLLVRISDDDDAGATSDPAPNTVTVSRDDAQSGESATVSIATAAGSAAETSASTGVGSGTITSSANTPDAITPNDTSQSPTATSTTNPGGATQSAGSSDTAAAAQTGASSSSSNPASGSTDTSPLTADGQDILALAAEPTMLATLIGRPATGRATVESVVSDEGFWIGANPTSRVFVLLTQAARDNYSESPFQVAAGQTILLEGTANTVNGRIPSDVTEADGKDQLDSQNFVIDATSVELTSR